MIHVFREKEFFLVLLSPCSWRVSQFSTRVVIIIIMDHSYNNNNKWRLHAIFSDPRVWINRGSTMDQHGSTWISRLQHVAFSISPPSWLMRHASCVRLMCHASCVMRQTHGSWLMAHGSWLMRQTHGSWLMRQTSHVHSVTAAPFSDRRPLPVMTTTGTAAFSPCATLSDLRLLSCTAWGNRVVLPTLYSSTGANKNRPRRSKERRGLLLLIRKRPA